MVESKKIALSVPEAAALLSVSKSKLYEIMRQSDCDFVLQLGGRKLISRTRLEEWIDRKTQEKAG